MTTHQIALGKSAAVGRPNEWNAGEAVRRMAAREISAVELVDACLAQIDRFEPILQAWAWVAPETARGAAARLDEAGRTGGSIAGLLRGVPIGIKDIFNTADMPTAMGSPIWERFLPGNDARVVTELRLAGGIVLGKTVTAEFAVHTPGRTRNPHNPDHMPGTSSSGSAAAVAARMVPVALGTQTAGSVVRPASYCGVYGYKPSFGLVPRTGSLKTTDSLDTVGWFGRTVDDVALLFDVLRVRGRDYPVAEAAQADRAARRSPGAPWRIALVRGPRWDDAEEYAREALVGFASRLARVPGMVVEDVALPAGFDEAHEVHAAIYDKALSYYFRGESTREQLVSPIMKALIAHGQSIDGERYRAALARQDELARAIDFWFRDRYDILMTLSTGGEAPRGLESTDRPDTCLIWTMCGLPVLSIPAFSGPLGLPFGVQVAARRYGDRQLLDFASALVDEGVAPAEAPRPPLVS